MVLPVSAWAGEVVWIDFVEPSRCRAIWAAREEEILLELAFNVAVEANKAEVEYGRVRESPAVRLLEDIECGGVGGGGVAAAGPGPGAIVVGRNSGAAIFGPGTCDDKCLPFCCGDGSTSLDVAVLSSKRRTKACMEGVSVAY